MFVLVWDVFLYYLYNTCSYVPCQNSLYVRVINPYRLIYYGNPTYVFRYVSHCCNPHMFRKIVKYSINHFPSSTKPICNF